VHRFRQHANATDHDRHNLSGEVSLVGARGHDGSTVFYPLTHNLHQDGILRTSASVSPARKRH
jgi:5-(carboxyamino)imidazole ribonucleotide synthase